MLRYTESAVTFEEIPTEVSLSLSISGCQNNCFGCHSPELRGDIGEELTDERMMELLQRHEGVSCVLLLGEGRDAKRLIEIANLVHTQDLKCALYSGRESVETEIWEAFDYVKIGGYDFRRGALNKYTTNQQLFQKILPKVQSTKLGVIWKDITSMLWRK